MDESMTIKQGKECGKCYICGESTKLNIHAVCGKAAQKRRKEMGKHKAQKSKVYDDKFIDWVGR